MMAVAQLPILENNGPILPPEGTYRFFTDRYFLNGLPGKRFSCLHWRYNWKSERLKYTIKGLPLGLRKGCNLR